MQGLNLNGVDTIRDNVHCCRKFEYNYTSPKPQMKYRGICGPLDSRQQADCAALLVTKMGTASLSSQIQFTSIGDSETPSSRNDQKPVVLHAQARPCNASKASVFHFTSQELALVYSGISTLASTSGNNLM